jgi:hypothetical protein
MKVNQRQIVREVTYLAVLMMTATAGQWLTLGRINPAMVLAGGAIVVLVRLAFLRSPAPPA